MSSLFTSESVTEGHPDKMCDQISDAILDACLKEDPHARVAVEAAVKDNTVFVFGELTTSANINTEEIVRSTIHRIGYHDLALGFSADNADIKIQLSKQSPDIAQGLSQKNKDVGAGDQGIMFGYADNQTKEKMPLPITLAHKLAQQLSQVRKNHTLPWLRPDGKTQVTVRYENGKPKDIDTVVVSTQHDPDITLTELRTQIKKHIIDAIIPPDLQRPEIKIHINPTGRFVIGGPVGDAGLTGRKIIVDTYGGWARHGGGAFSGKDPSKVDRSAAYAARQAAKSIVAKGLAEKCEVQLAYAIGVAQPVGIFIETFGTEKVNKKEIEERVKAIDFGPEAIIERLSLREPRYLETATYGHFGRNIFPWEQEIII